MMMVEVAVGMFLFTANIMLAICAVKLFYKFFMED